MARAAKKQKLSDGSVATAVAVDGVAEPQPNTEGKSPGPEKTEQHRRSLFVRSLPPTATSESLTDLFSESYPIKHATAVTDPNTKQCRGYGFVTFADAEDAQRAKQQFNGHVLDGRKLRVEVAEPRHRDNEGGADVEKSKVKPERETQQPPKLIVRNLPWSIKGSHQLEKLFQSYGKIKQAYVPKKGPGLMAGFGFVLMRGRKNAEKAMEEVNGKEVDGRTLAVDWAVEKDAYQNVLKDDTQEQRSAEDDGTPVHGAADDEHVDEMFDDEVGADDESGQSESSEGEDDDDGDDVDIQIDGETESVADQAEEKSTTLFVRNLPFTCTDEDLEDHFTRFGSVRYARVVMDAGTERSKGTGFVCLYEKDDADACLRSAPRRTLVPDADKAKDGKGPSQAPPSILQNDEADPSGQYTLDGRVLQVSRAVNKSEASRLTDEGTVHRNKRDKDKRRLYLLSEGTISTKSQLWDKLSPSEKTMRDASARQRKKLIESNPSLHLSLTRLSVRNIPRSIDSKELKALARESVVGFATDVKNGARERLSKEELARGGDEMVAAEAARKRAGKGLVRQAKVVFEGSGGSKVSESTGAGRSRGYGFIEYYTHRSALMGLRWLNGHAVGYKVKEGNASKHKLSQEDTQDRKKRLIVEFAIENAQVVLRRKDREQKARDRSTAVVNGTAVSQNPRSSKAGGKPQGFRKRKRDAGDAVRPAKPGQPIEQSDKPSKKQQADEKLAKRNQIIGRKRAVRKARKGKA